MVVRLRSFPESLPPGYYWGVVVLPIGGLRDVNPLALISHGGQAWETGGREL